MNRNFQSLGKMQKQTSKDWKLRSRSRSGITLPKVLLLVVVVVVCAEIFLWLILPEIRHAQWYARLTMAECNGRDIYQDLTQEDGYRHYLQPVQIFGSSSSNKNTYADSTSLFADLIARGLIATNYNMFVVPDGGVEAARNAKEFSDGTLRNIWCATLDTDGSTTSTVPVLFSQNFAFIQNKSNPTLNQMIGLELKARPYHGEWGVVIDRDGSGYVLTVRQTIRRISIPPARRTGFSGRCRRGRICRRPDPIGALRLSFDKPGCGQGIWLRPPAM